MESTGMPAGADAMGRANGRCACAAPGGNRHALDTTTRQVRVNDMGGQEPGRQQQPRAM